MMLEIIEYSEIGLIWNNEACEDCLCDLMNIILKTGAPSRLKCILGSLVTAPFEKKTFRGVVCIFRSHKNM